MVIKSQAPLPVNPSISINDVTITEGNSGNKNATFTISLSEATSNSVAVDFATADGTATAGSDYTSKTGTISIPPGNISATITVSGKGDKVVEPNETFFVNLSNPLSGTIADGEGVCTILNND
jgi:hypothetical protein